MTFLYSEFLIFALVMVINVFLAYSKTINHLYS